MSGISCNRNKKNGKKSKFVTVPGKHQQNSTATGQKICENRDILTVLQVKSLKLDHSNKASSSQNDTKSNAKSEDDLRKARKAKDKTSEINGNHVGDVTAPELEASFVQRLKNLNVDNSGGESNASKTSDHPHTSGKSNSVVEEAAATAETVGDFNDTADYEEQYASYKFYPPKTSKSIKFTNQVTVLYFNGEDILCQSSEPLKKEVDQQIRNKEMRKEHLLSKGQFDNVYLF